MYNEKRICLGEIYMDFTKLSNGQYEGFAVIKRCDRKVTSKGTDYLDMKLSDKSGEISAKLWDYVPATHGEYETDILVKVRGEISKFAGADQMRITKIRRTDENDNVDISDYVKSADYSGEYMFDAIIKRAQAFEDEELKKLVIHIYNSNKDKLLTFPAAFRLHHAIRGGLLMHTLSIIKLCEAVCEIYPYVNRDLLITGAALHDIAKLTEYEVTATGTATGYTVEGNLIGHLVKGAIIVDKVCDELGISKEKAMLVEHMLISHHGEPEFGAAVRPMFIEAELLSELDNLDAKMYQMSQAVDGLEKDAFSSRLWALNDRKLFNYSDDNKDFKVNLD